MKSNRETKFFGQLYCHGAGDISTNQATGRLSFRSNVTGLQNTIAGVRVAETALALSDCTINGYQGGRVLVTGQKLTGVGSRVMQGLLNGVNNSLVGESAGSVGTAFNRVTGIGGEVLLFNTSDENTGGGYQAGRNNTVGTKNTYWGTQTGLLGVSVINGNYFGHRAGATTNHSNVLLMGAGAESTTDNQVSIGSVANPLFVKTVGTIITTHSFKARIDGILVDIPYRLSV